MATSKWVPPADFEAKLVPPPPPSGVDLTMDDQQAGLPRTAVGTTPPASQSPSSSSTVPTVPPSTRPRFKNETSLAEETADIAAARQSDSGRALLIVGACFLIGALAMGLIAYKAGLLGGHAGAKGDPSASASLAVASAQPVVMEPDPTTPSTSISSIPPLATGKPSAGATASRAIVDVSSARPGVGQPVDLVGRLLGPAHARVDGAHFHISGPGIAPGTDLSAVDDGTGAFHASFTFMQAGRFEVDFAARADGAQTRAARLLVVGDGKTASPAGTSTDVQPPAPAATPSGKWM